ncbi:hypothetical protein [Jeotgalicoccus psychrophilus]|uniref:hypothetical protein n=1 Tax=Jeotgalicoccus psychrophilus TaxID=157228 RepID=UPI000407BC35|nr:hypothetical protein [Jeotgalicoccus psychrophilus]
METKNINDVEHIPISSIELDGSEDITERLNRAKEELQTKQVQRQSVLDNRELTAHIKRFYGKDLKDVGAFITLCKVKKLTADDDKAILNLFKNLPKSSRKSALSRFLKL